MMALALAAARRGLGTTAPNPSVGAVIVDSATGEVISTGWTQPGGRPHAEPEAIRQAGARSRGATLYVTLEPCSHYGKTPPCAEGIIAAGLRRVVTAILDPDPRVSGRGVRMLREAGIEVRRGVLADEAHWVTRGHILRVTERRPLIQLKMALSADGNVPRGSDGRPVWVTGPQARAHGHMLRAEADAIMVGSGTVADDDPELTCRLPGLEWRSPVRVVLASRRLPSTGSRLARSAREIPVWIMCAPGSDPAQLAALAQMGCRIFPVTTLDGRLWLPAVCEALVAEGITRLLVEGGPTLWRAFAGAGLVDEIVCYRALGSGGPRGGDAAADESGAGDMTAGAAAAERDLAALGPAHAFALVESREIAADGLFVFRRK